MCVVFHLLYYFLRNLIQFKPQLKPIIFPLSELIKPCLEKRKELSEVIERERNLSDPGTRDPDDEDN